MTIIHHFSSPRREEMVSRQIRARGVSDERVLRAMGKVERHLFVPENERIRAYNDTALPIGYGQTISQPFIVGYMTAMLDLKSQDRVLEIGTGSGYQTAILAEIVREVYTVEIIEQLAERALDQLARLGYSNIHVRCADGAEGWPEQEPFDAVMITAAPEDIPPALLSQLKPRGKLIAPVGLDSQVIHRLTKTDSGLSDEALLTVRFVPMVSK